VPIAQERTRISIRWQAIRYHFIPPSFLPAILGAVVAGVSTGKFSWWYFGLVLIGVISNHAALNMTDEYYDYKYSIDALKPGEKNPYAGGSGVLTGGLIKAKDLVRAFLLGYLVTILIGLYLTVKIGWPILAFGVFGMFCSYFYTAPPVKFAFRGWGEMGLLVNFGSTIGLGSYFVQTQSLSWEAFWATLPLGIMLFSMIVINEIPDYDEDRKGGKLTLIARYGKAAGVKLYIISLILAYMVMIGAVVARIVPLTALIVLGGAPLVYRSIKILRKNYDHPLKMMPANLTMIRIHSLTGILLITAYAWQGIRVGSLAGKDALLLLLILAFLYVPLARSLLTSGPSSKVLGKNVDGRILSETG
ncbi:MAG: prenyltransferase, partial [bacterium]